MRKTKRVMIEVPTERWLALRNEAARRHRSIAGLVLEALQGFLRDLPPHLMHADEFDADEQQEAACMPIDRKTREN